MVTKKYRVIWDKLAKEGLDEISDHIKKESVEAAKKVRSSVLLKTKELATKAEIYEQDRFKQGNTGNYRAFEHYSCRVTYKIAGNQVLILRVRHVKKNPLNY